MPLKDSISADPLEGLLFFMSRYGYYKNYEKKKILAQPPSELYYTY